VLVRLEEAGLKKNLASDPFADDLYDLVDANGDGTRDLMCCVFLCVVLKVSLLGTIDKGELLSGLSLTCKVSNKRLCLFVCLFVVSVAQTRERRNNEWT
jgi:hypothetical protein